MVEKTRVLQEEAFAFDHYWSASDETSRLVHMDKLLNEAIE